MAPESQQTPDPEKVKKTRSFGSFLLFLFVLIVVVAYIGSEQLAAPKELTQDDYLWYLYSGRIEKQEFRGTENGSTLITGTFSPDRAGEQPRLFEARFADVGANADRFRELQAADSPLEISYEDFFEAVDGGWYVPVDVHDVIVTKKDTPETGSAPPADEDREQAAAAVDSAPGDKTTDHLFVHVAASSLEAWKNEYEARTGEPATSEPDFRLPDQTAHLWLKVDLDGVPNISTALERLSKAGATIERIPLDRTDGRGATFADSNSLLTTVLFMWGPWILIFAVFLIVLRQMRSQGGAGGVMSFGRSRAQLYTKENRTNVTFDDVAGASEAKDEVREIVEFLKNPGRFTRIGGRIPRGVLLVGPPGCGKTLLAKAIAGEAEVPFFSISGSDFVEMFVGVGASRVRDLFKQARDNSPCIIFLDEIDAVGRRRGSGMGGGHDEREQTLNAILVEMDGFGTDEGIIVIAATNRPDVLDPALLRPGRFDREVAIDLPDLEGRTAILDVHLKRVKVGDDVDVAVLGRSTPGYSGADLAAIVNEAAIMAVLAKRDEICMEDLEEARDKVRYGRQKRSRKIEEEDRKITAYHEAGHAVVAAALPETDHPHKVTIVPRGRALGATMVLPEKESYHMQKKRLLGQLAMLFGGRVAEAEFCGDISAGASDDIRRATDLARSMVTELGMSESIGPINYAERQGSDFLGTELMRGKTHSEETAREIDREVHGMLRGAYDRAVEIVQAHRGAMDEMAKALLEYETINGDEVLALVDGKRFEELRPEPPEPRPPSPPDPRPAADPADDNSPAGELPGTPGFSPA